MGAALEVGAQWWDDRTHPVNDDGAQGREELARACADVWLASIRMYYADCAAALRGQTAANDQGEAFLDLWTGRELLKNLCEPLDADPEVVGDAMMEALRAGRTSRKWFQ
ncbi:hypothetical protein BWR19_17105 [Halomonas sp. 1513]|nr:hypothetical protein [Halomonas sp. 1513]APX94511.1 hypothetical protein BWR19_17105 [Halomonas sp. 1513]